MAAPGPAVEMLTVIGVPKVPPSGEKAGGAACSTYATDAMLLFGEPDFHAAAFNVSVRSTTTTPEPGTCASVSVGSVPSSV